MKRLILAALVAIAVICATSCRKDPPIPPNIQISGQVESVGQDFAVISGKVSEGVTSCLVCWDTIDNPTTNGKHFSVTPNGGHFTATISDLLPQQRYYVRLYAAETYSSSFNFTTSSASITAETRPATDIGLHSAILNGYFILTNGSADYWFEYGETSAYGYKTPEQTTSAAGANNVNAPISDLTWHQTYHFRLVVRQNGQEIGCGDKAFATLGDVPSIGAIFIDNESLDKTIIRVIINPHSLPTTVTFFWGESTNYSHSSPLPNPINGEGEIEVIKEIPVQRALEYHFQVQAENLIGSAKSADTTAISLALIDSKGKKYHACKIGNDYWLTANWQATSYNNGDPIPYVSDPAAWGAQTRGALCYYANDPTNYAIYGPLYNWYAISDPRGLCPNGWHVSTYQEWITLYDNLGGFYALVGGKLKETGFIHWFPANACATNSIGFTALPGGYRGQEDFTGLNESAYFWSMDNITSGIYVLGQGCDLITAYVFPQYYGFSVRLVKD